MANTIPKLRAAIGQLTQNEVTGSLDLDTATIEPITIGGAVVEPVIERIVSLQDAGVFGPRYER